MLAPEVVQFSPTLAAQFCPALPSASCQCSCWSKPSSTDSCSMAKPAPVTISVLWGAAGAKGSRSGWVAAEGPQQWHWFAVAAGAPRAAPAPYQHLRRLKAGLHLLRRGMASLPPSPTCRETSAQGTSSSLWRCPYGSVVL